MGSRARVFLLLANLALCTLWLVDCSLTLALCGFLSGQGQLPQRRTTGLADGGGALPLTWCEDILRVSRIPSSGWAGFCAIAVVALVSDWAGASLGS